MKAEELRIGNIAMVKVYRNPDNFEDFTYEQVVINAKHIYNGYLNEDLKYFKPVHLTPEILEKAGFKEVIYDVAALYELGDLSLFELDFGEGWGLTMTDKSTGSYTVIVKYLHQLQNLFYDLKGQELPINL